MGSVKLSIDVVPFWPHGGWLKEGHCVYVADGDIFTQRCCSFPQISTTGNDSIFHQIWMPLITRCTYFVWQKHCQLHRDTPSQFPIFMMKYTPLRVPPM